MRKAQYQAPPARKSGARHSLDMHAAASQPGRSETRLTLDYTPGAVLTILRGARISMSLTWPRLELDRADRCRNNSYCRPYTAMQPLALCVVQSEPRLHGHEDLISELVNRDAVGIGAGRDVDEPRARCGINYAHHRPAGHIPACGVVTVVAGVVPDFVHAAGLSNVGHDLVGSAVKNGL